MRGLTAVVAILLAAGLEAGDWPQWRGAARDGIVSQASRSAPLPARSAKRRRWKS